MAPYGTTPQKSWRPLNNPEPLLNFSSIGTINSPNGTIVGTSDNGSAWEFSQGQWASLENPEPFISFNGSVGLTKEGAAWLRHQNGSWSELGNPGLLFVSVNGFYNTQEGIMTSCWVL